MTEPTSQPQDLAQHELLREKSWLKSLTIVDWLFAALMASIAALAQLKLPHHMDVYEMVILWASAVIATGLGWFFKPMRWFIVGGVLAAYLAVGLYQGDIANAGDKGKFLLKYLLSSQSAIMWQAALTVLAFALYLLATLWAWRQEKQNRFQRNTLFSIASGLAWSAAFAGFVGLLVRWHESYLLRPDAGHIPVSNLYEVGEIQPLIPALQSWWMKLHVPANFIGYGGFCMAAAFGVAELLSLNGNKFFPDAAQIEEAMYKAIAVGFLFFTIATILGALWAADAWGRYWSWDPKETWAFIVWLNYAVWLHMRLVAGWRGKVLAWWAVIGLFITAFAFVGVNKYLTGLHSYGSL